MQASCSPLGSFALQIACRATDALEQAVHQRQPGSGLVHHSDRGSQYLSIRHTERLAEAGIEPSVGGIGDSYENALAETINGLFKAEVIHRRDPWRCFDAVEYAALEWLDCFNNRRLLHPFVPQADHVDQPRSQQIILFRVGGGTETTVGKLSNAGWTLNDRSFVLGLPLAKDERR
jgi:hypothetical protein